MADQRSFADVTERQTLSRREFLSRAAMLALFSSAGSFVLSSPSRAMATTPSEGTVIQQAPITIAEVGKLFRDGSLTSEALTRTYLECIKRFHSQLNAVITLMEEQALATAADRDAELRAGKDRGPLHGIPIVHKDIYDTAGVS